MQRRAVGGGDLLDLQPLVVEDDALGVGLCFNVERRGSADPLGVEIDAQVEREMGHPRLERLGITVDIDRICCVEDRRDGRRGSGIRLGRGRFDLTGGQQQRRGGGNHSQHGKQVLRQPDSAIPT